MGGQVGTDATPREFECSWQCLFSRNKKRDEVSLAQPAWNNYYRNNLGFVRRLETLAILDLEYRAEPSIPAIITSTKSGSISAFTTSDLYHQNKSPKTKIVIPKPCYENAQENSQDFTSRLKF